MIDATRRDVMTAAAGALGALSAAVRGHADDTEPLDEAIDEAVVSAAERALGVTYTPAERSQLLAGLEDQLDTIRAVRAVAKPNALAPAQTFDPRLPGVAYPPQHGPVTLGPVDPGAPAAGDDLAFAPLWRQALWMESGAVTSRALTELYLDRIAALGPQLECFVTVTGEDALAQAEAADAERALGRRRGWLHGVPYGLKDLFDAAGVKTTWGATPYADTEPALADSAVAAALKEAGAVLVGKTTTGALAYGDIWFGGVTRNPWNVNEGSSGSSAGSASATAAGLISFGVGTETLGSIVSPSHRCGTTGLRPTFGRVSRAGGMALCWSLDKVGAICRSVADTALVLDAMAGADVNDPSSLAHGFEYDGASDVRGMIVGHAPALLEGDALAQAALAALKDAGATLKEVRVPEVPSGPLVLALLVEAAAAFEELTLTDQDDTLVWQDDAAWPNGFRMTRFVSAIDYVQIDRMRRALMAQMHTFFEGVDVVVGGNFAGGLLTGTNFTGQPQLALRAGFAQTATRDLFDAPQDKEPDGAPALVRTPQAVSLWAGLFEERRLIQAGRALEARLGVADERPPL